jgi:hypothetical protein
MKRSLLLLTTASLASPAAAQETREMAAHEHGVSSAEIAVEHGRVEINIHAPGMDIVGFEHVASSSEDKDSVAAAIRQFLVPEEIVSLPEAADCRLTEVVAHLHGGAHDEEGHGDHSEEEDHDHEEHDHAEKDHAAKGAEHSEFHVTYGFDCEDESALTAIAFPFFERFQAAREIEVQYVTEAGAGQAELTPGAPELTLE